MKLNALDYLGISDYFSEEEIMVQNTARTFVEKEVMPIIEEFYKKGEFPEHLISKFAELVGGIAILVCHFFPWGSSTPPRWDG